MLQLGYRLSGFLLCNKQKNLALLQGFRSTKYKIRTYDPIRVKDVLYH